MEDNLVERFAFENLPVQLCALTQQPIEDPVVMHRDLSDNWPSELKDMRDERLVNLMIVERSARDRYYEKLKQLDVVVSFSGGLDSTTVLYWARKLFNKVHPIIFDYGQRHKIEIKKAKDILINLGYETYKGEIDNFVIKMNHFNKYSNSSLVNMNVYVPERNSVNEIEDIPNTFVPGRNIYFFTFISQVAYQLGCRHIACGVNAIDGSGYPDCKPEFISALRRAIEIGIFNGTHIGFHAPLVFLKKTEIIRLGQWLGVPFEMTHSCYNGVSGGCGKCDSCILRRNAFNELGIEDPSIKE